MPSKKKQHNIRLNAEQEAKLDRLRRLISGSLGGVSLSVTDVFVMALGELEKKYAPQSRKRGGGNDTKDS